MSLKDDLEEQVTKIFHTQWKSRDGTTVPETDDLKLGNDAVKLEGTVLYADLVDSTGLVDSYKAHFAAEIYKAYLDVTSRIITAAEASITAFDGDRVMAVFIGDSKNTRAAKTALQIHWAVRNVINPGIKKEYPNTSFQLNHAVGIDVAPLFITRAGIRGSNDLVWVGSAANYAAKLCTVRQSGYKSFMTERVYKNMADTSKFGGNPKKDMWDKLSWPERSMTIYGSSWTWAVS